MSKTSDSRRQQAETKVSLIGLLIGCFLISLDPNLVGIVTPELVGDLQATPMYGWVAGSYLMALTLAVPVVGRLVEIYSGRRIYLFSLVLFLIGTTLAGLANSIETFIIFRVIQGFGAGGIFAANFAIAAILFPPREQGVVLSYFNVISGLAMVGGAVVGGMLADYGSWRLVFLANLLPGILALVLLAAKLPDLHPQNPGKLDLWGAVSLFCWCVPLMLLCSRGGSGDSWSVGGHITLATFLLLGLAWFARIESRHSDPLLDPKFLKNPVFRWGSIAAWCVGVFSTGVMTYIPLFTVEAQDLSATKASFVLIFETVFAIIGSVASGRLLLRWGRYKPMMVLGNAGITLVLFWASRNLDAVLAFWKVLCMVGALGLLFGLIMPLYPLAIQNSVDRKRAASATTAVQFFQMLGSGMGAALSGVVLAMSLHQHFPQEISPQLQASMITEHGEGFQEKESLQDHFKEELQKLRTGLTQARAGDAQAITTLRPNPLLTEELRRLIDSDHADSEAKVQSELTRVANEVAQRIDDVIDATTVRALRAVYGTLGGISLLSLILSLLLPGLPLRSAHSEPPPDS